MKRPPLRSTGRANHTNRKKGFLPSKAACTLLFRVCVAEALAAALAVAAADGGPPAEEGGLVRLMIILPILHFTLLEGY